MTGSNFHVAIIGGGASGVLTAAQLHRQQPDLSVALIDSTGSGRGLAYGTPHLVHLLNVPAGNMSAFPDQPEHFHYWLRQIDPWAARTTFAPRKLYGDYLNHVLDEACRAPSKVERITGTAVAVERGGSGAGWTVRLEDGRVIAAKSVVLALGNLPPGELRAAKCLKGPRYFNDPWAVGALEVASSRQPPAASVSQQPTESTGSSTASDPASTQGQSSVVSRQSSGDSINGQPSAPTAPVTDSSRLTAEAGGWRLAAGGPVLLIGTGLTAIDVVLALRAQGHNAPIHAISRRGLLPKAHAPCEPWKLSEDLFSSPVSGLPSPADSPLSLLRWLRAEVRRAEGAEGNTESARLPAGPSARWRGVIDALRPRTATIWGRWSERERARFLRHARAYWEVHRHRAAPEIAGQIEKLMATGLLQVHKGRIISISESKSCARVRWLGRNRMEWELEVDRVINCTGPDCDFSRLTQPLIVQMREAGLLVPDALRLSIETDEQGRLLGKSGEVIDGLWAVGPLRKARLWESTAMPEIRVQAEGCARLVGESSRTA